MKSLICGALLAHLLALHSQGLESSSQGLVLHLGLQMTAETSFKSKGQIKGRDENMRSFAKKFWNI